jgi:hypothetical protein
MKGRLVMGIGNRARSGLWCSVVSASLILLGLGGSPSARCDDQNVAVEEDLFPDEKPADGAADDARNRANQFEMALEQYDQWVFGGGRLDQSARERLQDMLDVRCQAVRQVANLTDAQVQKLQLAGKADIQRFLRRYDAGRAKFEVVRRDRAEFNNIWQDIQPLQQQINAGLFESDSVFQKVLARIIDSQQSDTLSKDAAARRKFGYEARVERAIAQWDKLTPLTRIQRDGLMKLLLATPPPKRFGEHDTYYILWRLSEVPEKQIRPLLEPTQWKFIRQQREQGTMMKQFLEQQQVVPDDDAEAGDAPAAEVR